LYILYENKIDFTNYITLNVQWADLSLKSDVFQNLWMDRKVRKILYTVTF
jgi:hypothetical protein